MNGRRTPRIGRVGQLMLALGAVTVFSCLGAVAAHAEDVEIGALPDGVSVEITGSGGTYWGDSIQVTISNTTREAVTVVIPVGTQFIPVDGSVQTMVAAGGERIVVPPGEKVTQVVKAFCGEQHDRGPLSTDKFEVGPKVTGDLAQTVERIHDREQYDLSAQHAVWHHTDGYDVSADAGAGDLVATGDDQVEPADAAAAGLAVAAAGGAAAVAVSRSRSRTPVPRGPRRELRSGAGAIDALLAGGARTVQLPDGVFVIPPDDLPDTVDAMAFDTKVINGVEVIDPGHIAVWTRGDDTTVEQPLPPPEPAAPPPEEPPEQPAEPPPVEEPAVVTIDEDERKRIIEWGLKYQHTAEEIQRDIDDRNRQLGGSGTVPVDDLPVTLQLPDGSVTVTRAEADEYQRLRQTVDENQERVDRITREYRRNQLDTEIWTEQEQAVFGRFGAGLLDVVTEANRMRNPEQYMATSRGCSSVRELQIRDYGRPNPQDYVFKWDEYERQLAAWERGPDADRFVQDRRQVQSDALHAIQQKTDPEAGGQTSWLNKPIQKLREINAKQDALLAERRELGVPQRQLHELEQRFRSRIPTPGGD